MDKREKPDSNDRSKDDSAARTRKPVRPDPPRTTKGKWTSPKFGSAGSGGAELEPGPEKE
jgi:hypothetical protein